LHGSTPLSFLCSVVFPTPYFFAACRTDLNWPNLKACSARSNLASFERFLGGRGEAIVICGYFKNWWGKVAHFGDVAHVVIKYVTDHSKIILDPRAKRKETAM
jgi:hypothetical protein